ncbi:MAG: aldo/keto reductase [Planctomycetota bacterium]
MQYRFFGSLEFRVSALGFGCMRLPTLEEEPKQVDEDLAVAMIRYAIDHGVNYVDTAYPYHGGQSERVLGKALADGYREKVKIATKLPTWACETADDFDRLLDEQLERLGVDRVDFYLLHNLQATLWPKVRDLGVVGWLEREVGGDRFGHAGFSFHHSYELFAEILDAFDGWTLAQVQYNFMNEQVQAGTKGVELAASRGLAVVVMEPLLGGCLAAPPPQVQAVYDAAPARRTPADWALQWLWHTPEVSVVLSGMSTMAQVEENVASAARSGVGTLSLAELSVIEAAREAYEKLAVVPCTACSYCMPCPEGVDIPRNFRLLNDARVFGGNQTALTRNLYRGLPEPARAAACVACKECEEKCPQGIAISEWMPTIAEQFEE